MYFELSIKSYFKLHDSTYGKDKDKKNISGRTE